MDDRKLYSRAAQRRGRPAPRAGGSNDERPLWALIAVNIAVFVLWHTAPPSALPALAEQLLVVASGVLSRPWTALTYAFSHNDASHLLYNLCGLWVFGRSLLHESGPRALFGLDAGGAVGGALAPVLASASPALGASAAVTAVSIVYAIRHPHRSLLVMFIVPMPAWAAVGLFIALDVVGLVGPPDGVAHAAHLGGAAVGAAYAWPELRRRLQRR